MGGNPILQVLNAGYGTTPDCPGALFKPGDWVRVRATKHLRNIPPELVVLIAVPPDFPSEYALADLLGEPRPLMITAGSRAIRYILALEGDERPYILNQSALLPSDKPPVEIGTITRAKD